jgi:hypothetical protein
MPGVGFGFFECYANEQRAVFHTGDHGDHCLLLMLPDHRLGFFLVYRGSDQQRQLRQRFTQQFFDRYFPAEVPFAVPAPKAEFAARARRYAGTYRMSQYSRSTIEKLAATRMQIHIGASGDGALSLGIGNERLKVVEVEPLLFRADDGTFIAFQEDPDGRITHASARGKLISDPLSLEKIPWYEDATLHLQLAGACFVVFLSGVLAMPIRLFIRRFRRDPALAIVPRGAWVAAWLANIECLLVVASPFLLLAWAATKPWPIFEVPAVLKLVLSFLFVATLSSLLLLVFTVVAWKNGYWSRLRRVHFSLIALAGLTMGCLLQYWNLLGFRF